MRLPFVAFSGSICALKSRFWAKAEGHPGMSDQHRRRVNADRRRLQPSVRLDMGGCPTGHDQTGSRIAPCHCLARPTRYPRSIAQVRPAGTFKNQFDASVVAGLARLLRRPLASGESPTASDGVAAALVFISSLWYAAAAGRGARSKLNFASPWILLGRSAGYRSAASGDDRRHPDRTLDPSGRCHRSSIRLLKVRDTDRHHCQQRQQAEKCRYPGLASCAGTRGRNG